ncbi:hypothetical protein ACA910_017762 [Epithemia clementina (nom. ined.)]
MLIVSWNVAGWSSTVTRIDRYFKPAQEDSANNASSVSSNKKKRKLHPAAAIQHFMERHHADIFCLQEHKLQKQQLANRLEPCQASCIPGYESFWSCCVHEKYKGLNGVVTYAPIGSVVAADPAPLGSPDLDSHGRCIMTDHGSFCIFNIYAPNSSGHPLSFKMKFLQALRRAMLRQRERNKAVILVGDFNICHKGIDNFWKDNFVHIQDILTEVNDKTSGTIQDKTTLPSWKLEIGRHWEAIEKVMQTQEVVQTKTQNSMTNESYNKYRLAVTLPDGRRVHLGKHETSPDFCQYGYDFSASTYCDADTDEILPSREANVVRVSVLAELMAKLAGVLWDEDRQREIADACATEPRVSPTRQWLSQLLTEDQMVDSFRYLYPSAKGRFTCWHQFTNRRYENEGHRIDYCLVDQSLKPRIQRGSTLRCCSKDDTDEEFALGETAALRAATANGMFEPASYGGEGIQQASQAALDTQFGEAHTGMIYTPPSFSDHIAVSVLLENEDGGLLSQDHVLSTDAATRKAQPHKAQMSIASFFGAGNNQTSSTTTSTTAKTTRKAPLGSTVPASKNTISKATTSRVKKYSIMHHFQKQAN